MPAFRRFASIHRVNREGHYGALATKLLRTYTMQTEALAKLKRGGE